MYPYVHLLKCWGDNCRLYNNAVLMQEPVLQDKRQEHVKFCKYALKLLEIVTGKPLATQGIETSIDKIHKVSSSRVG